MTISGKTYRVKARGKFTLLIAFMIILIAIISSTVFGATGTDSLGQYEYIQITVQHGDTLWNIARTYMPGVNDIRRAVHILCKVNEISAHELKAGQVLLIPVN